VDGKVLTQKVEVKPDPRVKISPADLEESFRLALKLRDEISHCSELVIALQSVRRQLKDRADVFKQAGRGEEWIKRAKETVAKLDTLEALLHNPKAEVTYDILAQKGGAKLYSQLAPLYDFVKDSDGPITQGMREVSAECTKEFAELEGQWNELVNDVYRLSRDAGAGNLPAIVVPTKRSP
jgi:hypothetical protein